MIKSGVTRKGINSKKVIIREIDREITKGILSPYESISPGTKGKTNKKSIIQREKQAIEPSILFFPILILPYFIPTRAATASPSIKRVRTIKEI